MDDSRLLYIDKGGGVRFWKPHEPSLGYTPALVWLWTNKMQEKGDTC